MLFNYLKDVRRMLRDGAVRNLNEDDLIVFVNRARREVAARTECIRRTPPISGAITTLTVQTPGSGYTSPVLTISPPDSPGNRAPYPAGAQATGLASIIGGQISNTSVTYGGDGYFQPTVTIADPTGTGARITAQTVPLSVLNPQQEEYRFTEFPIAAMPGVKSILAIKGIASLFNNLRYSWIYKPYTEYQAFIRTYTKQYFYSPCVWTQYGQGSAGSFLCYPIPSQVYQVELDCVCLPVDLASDATEEAIPEMWTDAVMYGAVALAYQELQVEDKAKYYWDMFYGYINKYRMYASPIRIPVVYARRY